MYCMMGLIVSHCRVPSPLPVPVLSLPVPVLLLYRGCGSVHDITIYSEQFKGKGTIQEYLLVTEVKSHMHTFSSVDMVYIFSTGSLGGEDLDDNHDLLIFIFMVTA